MCNFSDPNQTIKSKKSLIKIAYLVLKVPCSVRGRSKSVGRGRFLTTDRPVDFDRPTVKPTVYRFFPVIFTKNNVKMIL